MSPGLPRTPSPDRKQQHQRPIIIDSGSSSSLMRSRPPRRRKSDCLLLLLGTIIGVLALMQIITLTSSASSSLSSWSSSWQSTQQISKAPVEGGVPGIHGKLNQFVRMRSVNYESGKDAATGATSVTATTTTTTTAEITPASTTTASTTTTTASSTTTTAAQTRTTTIATSTAGTTTIATSTAGTTTIATSTAGTTTIATSTAAQTSTTTTTSTTAASTTTTTSSTSSSSSSSNNNNNNSSIGTTNIKTSNTMDSQRNQNHVLVQKNIGSTYSHKLLNPTDKIHPIEHLDCSDHGGPPDRQTIEEMIFWSDIPTDSSYISPLYDGDGPEKYLTFEPDSGGWNNIRMAMETALVMSHAMGRTLVLPPEKGMYLIDKNHQGQKSHFGFKDFFHLDAIAVEHKGFRVITTEEFLSREALTGRLRDDATNKVEFPPDNRTKWDNFDQGLKPLFQYLRTVSNTPDWDPWQCALAIPSSKDPHAIIELNTTLHSIMDGSYGKPKPTLEEFNGNPTPVNASMAERMREMLADRETLCIYDKTLQDAKVIHLKVEGDVRLLTHFYAFLFFADWRQDLWSKRFVRDHLRYVDEIICAAARVVAAVKNHAKNNKWYTPSMKDGVYDALHVRRGDFQYTPTRLPAEELYQLSKEELAENATLYIATDERNKTFFEPFKRKYDVVFLDDFLHVISDVNTNYYGMIDQLVAYKSRVFYGTWWSTLSGYVNRMRGYYITKHKLEGYKDGTMKSWYFTPPERVLQMRTYIPVRKPIYCKEFAIAWRDIDQGIDEIAVQ